MFGDTALTAAGIQRIADTSGFDSYTMYRHIFLSLRLNKENILAVSGNPIAVVPQNLTNCQYDSF
ncbi:hypothetical protein EON65_28530 [archaeon]|nr:MAG: hypothetical protein EON65_28530 [archaeon]